MIHEAPAILQVSPEGGRLVWELPDGKTLPFEEEDGGNLTLPLCLTGPALALLSEKQSQALVMRARVSS